MTDYDFEYKRHTPSQPLKNWQAALMVIVAWVGFSSLCYLFGGMV